MKKRSLAFLSLSLLLGSALWADDPSCDCGLGKVVIFEFDVKVARPTDPIAILRYWGLFRIARLTRAKMTADQSCSRLMYIDGNILPSGTLRAGIEQSVTAPPGPLNYDYVFTGEVTGSGGSYTAVARIEAGHSREVVKSASYTFKDPVTGSENPQVDAAADALAAQLSPMAAVITQWEKKKRDGDPGIARSNPDGTLTIRPSKKQLDEGETTDVEVEMVDCDGVPLKQRQIHFEPGTYEDLGSLEGTTNGKVQPPVVVTDDEGKAHVKYKAGDKRGPAEIHAWYGHHQPKGLANAIIGQSTVNVGAEQLSFRTVVDVKIEAASINHTETHHSDAVYTPYPGSGSNCTTAMRPGEQCRFAITTLHATASAKWPKGSHTASTSATGNAVEAVLTRGAQGATLRLAGPEFATMSPDQDDEHYIGICIDQPWKPMQFDLTEKEMENFSTLSKSLSITSPLGENSCVGSGTLVVTGQR